MRDHSIPERPRLGVSEIVTGAFSIYFKRPFLITAVGFVLFALAILVANLIFGLQTGTIENVGASDDMIVLKGVVEQILTLVVGCLFISVIFLMSFDLQQRRPVRLLGYFGAVLPRLPLVTLLFLLISIPISLGYLALILPGLWIGAVFSMVLPVAVIEGAGFGSLRRSIALTKGYRWPIVGVELLVALFTLIILMPVAGVLLFAVTQASLTSLLLQLAAGGITALGMAISYGLIGVAAGLLYARLREIEAAANQAV
ncbi:MAG: hypothetical protein OIF40_10445 [Mangrovicoccus sp.]|nr:hypothetical protein [Mangrovicoccus sp.]